MTRFSLALAGFLLALPALAQTRVGPLTIQNNLSEIGANGPTAQAAARGNLGVEVAGSAAAEATRALAAEAVIAASVAGERTRALTAEAANATSISSEIIRATGAEGVNATAITTEATTARANEATLTAAAASAQATANAAVPKAGGTMTGPLVLSGPPTAALNPATKAYADAETTRATAAEAVNAGSVTSEATRAIAAEGANTTAITTEAATARNAANLTTGTIPAGRFGDASGASVTATGSTTARTAADRAADVINVKDRGAKGDGTSDDYAALTALFAGLSPNKSLYFPCGKYPVSAGLILAVASVTLTADGPNCVTIAGQFAAGDVLYVHDANGFALRGIRIASDVLKTSGAALHINHTAYVRITDFWADGQSGTGNLFDGLWLDRVDHVTTNQYQLFASNRALIVNGTAGAGLKADAFFSSGKISGQPAGKAITGKCIVIGGGFGGFYIEAADIIHCTDAVTVDTSIEAEGNREIFFGAGSFIDSQTGYGIRVNDAMASGGTIQLSGTWVASAALGGIYIQNWANSYISLVGGVIFNNGADGINYSDATSRLLVDGTTIRGNVGWGVNAIPSVTTTNVNLGINKFSTNTLGNVFGAGFLTLPTGALAIDQNASTVLAAANQSATGLNTTAQVQAMTATASVQLQSNGTSRTATRYGVSVSGQNEVLTTAGNGLLIGTGALTQSIVFGTANTERFRIDGSGNVSVGAAALATTATNGFPYIPSVAGTPTGVPTSKTGLSPIVYDTTGKHLWIYNGTAWESH